jgi:hypothetical protein
MTKPFDEDADIRAASPGLAVLDPAALAEDPRVDLWLRCLGLEPSPHRARTSEGA